MESESSFYLTLPSNSSDKMFTSNKPQSYRVQLPRPIILDGKWEAALTEIQYPHNWININEKSVIDIVYQRDDDQGSVKPGTARYRDLDTRIRGDLKSADTIEIKLEAGYYANAEDILEYMMAAARKSFATHKSAGSRDSDFPLSFTMNNNSQKCVISSLKPAVLYPTKGTEHLRALGIYTDELKEGGGSIHFLLPVHSGKPFSVHKPTLYIYTDLVRYSMVGNALAPLLRTVTSSGKLGDNVSEKFTRPYYLPVSKGYISSVEIQINNDSGDLLKFISGKVVCIIHLRKVGI